MTIRDRRVCSIDLRFLGPADRHNLGSFGSERTESRGVDVKRFEVAVIVWYAQMDLFMAISTGVIVAGWKSE